MKAKIFLLSAVIALGMGFTACDDDDVHEIVDITISDQASVQTPVAEVVQPTYATLTAEYNLKSDYRCGGAGFCYSTAPQPTVFNNVVKSTEIGENAFTATLEGLQPNTVYYVRAYVSVYKGDIVYSPEFTLDTANVTELPSEPETPETPDTPEE